MSERRHRIYEAEIPVVMEGLRLLLERQLETKDEQEKAETAFRVLYRFIFNDPGRPKYPEFEWGTVRNLLYIYYPEENQ